MIKMGRFSITEEEYNKYHMANFISTDEYRFLGKSKGIIYIGNCIESNKLDLFLCQDDLAGFSIKNRLGFKYSYWVSIDVFREEIELGHLTAIPIRVEKLRRILK